MSYYTIGIQRVKMYMRMLSQINTSMEFINNLEEAVMNDDNLTDEQFDLISDYIYMIKKVGLSNGEI